MPLTAFQNTFAGNPLDRASDRRGDKNWLAGQLADPSSLGVVLWNGRPLVEDRDDGLQIAYLAGRLLAELAGGTPERMLFMGLWKETPVFAFELTGTADPSEAALQGLGRFEELRPVAARLPAPEAGIIATAKSMFDWHRRHDHCSACGEASRIADGGWKRVCPACSTEHFPRTDPVVIMLPYHGERCMLGRQDTWPPGMFSALAGFLEPGESIEEACARELNEEAGLHATAVRYHSSQPWPFPSQLMIGLLAEVEDEEGSPDQTELSEVRWFTRAEAADLLAGRLQGLSAPPPLAIAHQLLKAWVEEGA
ncbi:NAD(+) diphosphatase [Phenylobacterium deserti]|uniref:NAD(+) diphosphatase n=1 Tax=Phenylobacterium deserti TaxID=1914756 RepID=A0A328AVS7_9CAUL|nr:NAD(+) diphosphatase [Phenylobacterium deserti]RAK57796.1 NAD(+) diphosphatase [Phenylobacterium deserti]